MARPFSLAGLLRLRKLQEDQAAAEVSVARARAAEVAARQKYAENSLASLMTPTVDSESMRWTAAARASTSSALGELEGLEAEWALRTEDARARHAAARGNALGLEKLEAKHNAAEAGESLRAEQAVLDEIAARAWKIAQGDGRR
jgi:flagellar FliJ protein